MKRKKIVLLVILFCCSNLFSMSLKRKSMIDVNDNQKNIVLEYSNNESTIVYNVPLEFAYEIEELLNSTMWFETSAETKTYINYLQVLCDYFYEENRQFIM